MKGLFRLCVLEFITGSIFTKVSVGTAVFFSFLSFPSVHTLGLSYLKMACTLLLQSSPVSLVSVTSANVQASHSLSAVTQGSCSVTYIL